MDAFSVIYFLPRLQGRPNEAGIEMKALQYGESDTKEFIPGAEVILEPKKEEDDEQEVTKFYRLL